MSRRTDSPGRCAVVLASLAGLGGIPVEFKGGTIPAPDERRSYS
ncbi:hypothetical protein [Aeromicrobium piscarium]|nr:hypothetical protein [Aeromicrobium piscarium]